jgi:hypothetical protein
MSRPYIHITSASYATASGGVLTLNYQAYRVRGGGPATLSGLTNSVNFTILGTTLDGTESVTFSRTAIGGTPSGLKNLVITFPELGYNTGIYPDSGDPVTF